MTSSTSLNERFAIQAEQKRAIALSIAAVAAVLMATLWPYNFFPRNGVSWLQGTGGLKFEKAGLVISSRPLSFPESSATDSYTIDLLLRPSVSTKRYAYSILAFYDPNGPRQFWVMQYKDGLVVTHNASVQSDRTKTIKFDVDHFFSSGTLALVTISSGPDGTAVYRNGQRVGLFPGFRISRRDLSGTIVIGTSPEQYAPWSGELRGLAIYSKELSLTEPFRHWQEWTDPGRVPDLSSAIVRYAFAENGGQEVHNDAGSGPLLEIPTRFSVPYKGFLRSVPQEFKANRTYAKDVLENVVGFVPLGLILCVAFSPTRNRWRAVLSATIVCGILSLLIEVMQYWVPRRGSGVTDIITNTAGAALGAALVQNGAVRHAFARMKLLSD